MNESPLDRHLTGRRRALRAAGAALACVVVRPASSQVPDLKEALAAYTRGREVRAGRVNVDIARLIDNGNAVPMTVSVESPMTADNFVRSIAVFNERNPERDVVRFELSAESGRAVVSTRLRLATSQRIVAIATMSDGSLWSGAIDVVVTLAACIEGEP